MFNWSSSIGKVLGGHVRAQAARNERIARERLAISNFCARVVVPAMQNLGRECEAYGRNVDIRWEGNLVSLVVLNQDRVEFRYTVLANRHPARKPSGRYRDSSGYGRDVNRVYSLRDAGRLGTSTVAKHIVAAYRQVLASAPAP